MLLDRVPGADSVIFATHCHNDLGMATANAPLRSGAGARQIECTINGLASGRANALEEVVMALRVRNGIMPYRTGIDDEDHAGETRRHGLGLPRPVQQGDRRQETPSPTRAAIHDGMLQERP